MRLDRIMIKGSPFVVQNIQIVMNSPIFGQQKQVKKHGLAKGGLLFANDWLGWKLGREDKK